MGRPEVGVACFGFGGDDLPSTFHIFLAWRGKLALELLAGRVYPVPNRPVFSRDTDLLPCWRGLRIEARG